MSPMDNQHHDYSGLGLDLSSLSTSRVPVGSSLYFHNNMGGSGIVRPVAADHSTPVTPFSTPLSSGLYKQHSYVSIWKYFLFKDSHFL